MLINRPSSASTDERSAQLLINRPSSASTDERSAQLLINRPSSASTDERFAQLLINRPSSASTDERSAQLLINRPSSASTDERFAQLLINRPSSASTDERSAQLLINRPSSASTDERSAQLLINRPSSASTDERSAQLLINRPSSANTDGEVTTATIPTTNCNEHQGDRKIQSSWFTTYTWLQLLEGGMFFCKWCTKANMTNIFTKGKSADLPKKDDMRKHCQSRDHIASLKNVCQKKAFEKAVSNVYDSAKEKVSWHSYPLCLGFFSKVLYCQQ